MRNKVLIITGIVLLIACAVLNIMYVLEQARQDILQAKFQKVLVLKSKAMEKSRVQDRIKQ